MKESFKTPVSLIGEDEIAEIRYMPSFNKLLNVSTGFNLDMSKPKINNESKIKTKRENFCLAPLCKRAERIAIPKSSRLVDIFQSTILLILRKHCRK